MYNEKNCETSRPSPGGQHQTVTSKAANRLQGFGRSQSGAVAIIFALTLVMVVGLVGGAIDYGRWASAKSKQQQAIDAAVLAAGRTYQISAQNVSSATAAATLYYQELKSMLLANDVTTFQVVDNGKTVVGVTSGFVKTPFLSVVGIANLPVNITAKAILASGGNAKNSVEISLMLDITGSMSGSKVADLKLAAKDLVDIVVWEDQSNQYSRVAIAPFSENVNVGREYYEKVVGQPPSGSGTSETCVRERRTSDRYTDEVPGPGNYFDAETSVSWGGCRPQSTIMPLSNNKTLLKSHIDGFGTAGYTAGHLGTGWAWYLLSPKWNSVWAGDANAADYGANVRKIAVLMTDGEYNKQYSGAASTEQARQICSRMKATGITVYTIGFQISLGGEAYQTLQQCATSAGHFFNSTSGEELRQAFREIGLQIVTLRLSQ